MTGKTTDYFAFGLRIRSPVPLPLTPLPHPSEEDSAQAPGRRPNPDLRVRIGATPMQLSKPVDKRRHWETAPGACLATVEGVARYLATDGRDILVEPLGAGERDVGAFLVSMPLAALLQQRGLTTIHASSVGTEKGAALFTGFKGAGKSTLVATLVGSGIPLLGDDITGVALGADGCFRALPGVPFVRVAADSLEALGRQPSAFQKVYSKSKKYLMSAARLCTEPLPVQAVYVLQAHGGTTVEIKPLTFDQAVNALLRQTFRKRLLHGLGMEAEYIRTVERMAAQVPVFHVNRPARLLQLDALAERVMAHLQSVVGAQVPAPLPQPALTGEGGSTATGALTPLRATAARRRAVLCATQGDGGLLNQAKAVLRRKLAAYPHDPEALLRLGDVHRGEGNLQAALEAYSRVIAVRPEHPKASWLHAVLAGTGLPHPPTNQDPWPVPFVRAENFLPCDQHKAILALILAGGRSDFSQPATVNFDYAETSVRKSLAGGEEIVERAWRCLEPRLREFLPECLPRLRASELGDYRLVPLNANAYLGGGFYSAHSEASDVCLEPREINCVYYLHRRPKPFSGGDMLLHDGSKTNTFTRIEPLDNSLVVFPSSSVHEVTVVEGDPDDFGKGRFSVTVTLTRRTGGRDAAG